MKNQELLDKGKNWRVARDVFKKSKRVRLFCEHFQSGDICTDATFYGGGLDLGRFFSHYDIEGQEFLPEVPEGELLTSEEGYSIEITSLRKAFGVEEDRALAKILCREYIGKDGMDRLLEFARKAGCKIEDSIILID